MAPESRTIDRVASYRDIEGLKDLFVARWDAHHREHELLEQQRIEMKVEMDRRLSTMNDLHHRIEVAENRSPTRDEWRAEHQNLVSSLDEKYERILKLIELRATTDDQRFRSLERLVYMGMGAASLIGVVLHFWRG